MTEIERKIRFDVAIDIVNDVFTDMCREPANVVSRETAQEFAYFLMDMRAWARHLGGELSLEETLADAAKRSRGTVCGVAVKSDVEIGKE